tara:strand:- start:1437 stop:3863 length:2427 start_codon:yes stop_codon:yes gene_type:complete
MAEGKYTGESLSSEHKFGYNYPNQKLSDSQKNKTWYKKNIDYAEKLIGNNEYYLNEHGNKSENYNLRSNIIDTRNFEKYINPGQLELDKFPAKFQHVGIGNAKIDLLIGDYIGRKHDFRAYISSSDSEGNTRKEEALKRQLLEKVAEGLSNPQIGEEEIQKITKEIDEYARYDFQDIAEKTANAILKKESIQNNFDFTFTRTFEDLLVAGEEIMYMDVLGGKPVMRRLDPRKVFTSGGGSSLYLHDKDVIVIYDYNSVGQVIDDYWDHLSDKDVKKLERRNQYGSNSGGYSGNLVDNADQITGDSDDVRLINSPNSQMGGFGEDSNEDGEIRVVTVFWRSRRKIGKLTYLDEYGAEQITYVNEYYVPKEEEGEVVKYMWINEWLRGTKIGSDIYVKMQPVEHSIKSLTNISAGTPPIIGITMNTNGNKIQSMMDLLKPFDYAYNIGFWKRELEIATFKGTVTAVNAALIPSGFDPQEWLHYTSVDKLMFLDPTQEILKGPSQGKSAGTFNTFITQEVSMGANTQGIQMLTNYLGTIEATMGKIAGVSGAREGEIGVRSAVQNVQTELEQFSKITERWFQVDAEFRRLCLTKYLECCKIAYKENPAHGMFFLDDISQEYINMSGDFLESDFDINISNSTKDQKLFTDLRSLAQAAIQNGQATISDLVTIYSTNSPAKISRQLKESMEKIKAEQQQQQQTAQQSQEKLKQMDMQNSDLQRQFIADQNQKDRDSAERITVMRAQVEDMASQRKENVDLNKNGVPDDIDLLKAETDVESKKERLELDKQKLDEQVRHNKEMEEIQKEKAKKQ